MKRLHCILFIFFILLPSLCSGKTVVGFLIPESGLGDQSFNDMTYAGLLQSKKQHDFILVRELCGDKGSESQREAMERLINRNAEIIVVNGWEFQAVVKEYAEQFANRVFVIHDVSIPGFDNVISTVFAQHEGSFLAGVLAATMSKTGQVGFIGGMEIPVIQSFYQGFKEGVGFVGRNTGITAVYLDNIDNSSSGFNNPILGFKQANSFYNSGVDIIYSVAGLSGNGIIRSARENNRFVIGVDADQDHMAKGLVLTSVMKRLDIATSSVLEAVLSGNFKAGTEYLDLANGGVTLSPMLYTREVVPPELLELLEKIKANIISGEITVTDILQK